MNLLRQLHIKTEPLVYMSEKPKEQKKLVFKNDGLHL